MSRGHPVKTSLIVAVRRGTRRVGLIVTIVATAILLKKLATTTTPTTSSAVAVWSI